MTALFDATPRLGRGLINRQYPFEEELGDVGESGEILVRRVVDHLGQRASTIEQPQHRVQLVWHFAESLEQLPVLHREHGLERRELLLQSSPLVDPTHTLHQQTLDPDHLVLIVCGDRTELHFELTAAPDQRTVHRLLTAEPSQLGIEQSAIRE